MLQSDSEHDLQQFLKTADGTEPLCFVLAGAVVSGEYSKQDNTERNLIWLLNATISTGGSIAHAEGIYIPYERVLAWGYGVNPEDSPSE